MLCAALPSTGSKQACTCCQHPSHCQSERIYYLFVAYLIVPQVKISFKQRFWIELEYVHENIFFQGVNGANSLSLMPEKSDCLPLNTKIALNHLQ